MFYIKLMLAQYICVLLIRGENELADTFPDKTGKHHLNNVVLDHDWLITALMFKARPCNSLSSGTQH